MGVKKGRIGKKRESVTNRELWEGRSSDVLFFFITKSS